MLLDDFFDSCTGTPRDPSFEYVEEEEEEEEEEEAAARGGGGDGEGEEEGEEEEEEKGLSLLAKTLERE